VGSISVPLSSKSWSSHASTAAILHETHTSQNLPAAHCLFETNSSHTLTSHRSHIRGRRKADMAGRQMPGGDAVVWGDLRPVHSTQMGLKRAAHLHSCGANALQPKKTEKSLLMRWGNGLSSSSAPLAPCGIASQEHERATPIPCPRSQEKAGRREGRNWGHSERVRVTGEERFAAGWRGGGGHPSCKGAEYGSTREPSRSRSSGSPRTQLMVEVQTFGMGRKLTKVQGRVLELFSLPDLSCRPKMGDMFTPYGTMTSEKWIL